MSKFFNKSFFEKLLVSKGMTPTLILKIVSEKFISCGQHIVLNHASEIFKRYNEGMLLTITPMMDIIGCTSLSIKYMDDYGSGFSQLWWYKFLHIDVEFSHQFMLCLAELEFKVWAKIDFEMPKLIEHKSDPIIKFTTHVLHTEGQMNSLERHSAIKYYP